MPNSDDSYTTIENNHPTIQDNHVENDYLDRDNPRSVYNISPKALQDALDNVTKTFFEKSEAELHDQVKPDRILNQVRFKFWQEYNEAQDEERKIKLDNIAKGVCSIPYLRRRVLKSPMMIAWVLTPPSDYLSLAKESLETGLYRLREILEYPLYNKKGEPDTKVANLMLKAIHMLDQRVHGSPTQRHEIKSLNVQHHTKAGGDIPRLVEEANMDELESRLAKLRNDEEKTEILLESRPKYEEFRSGGIDVEPRRSKVLKKKGDKEF